MPFLLDLSPHFLSPLSNLPIQPQWEILNPNPQKSSPLGCLLQNLKALGFQGEIRLKRLIYYSNTVWLPLSPWEGLSNFAPLPTLPQALEAEAAPSAIRGRLKQPPLGPHL